MKKQEPTDEQVLRWVLEIAKEYGYKRHIVFDMYDQPTEDDGDGGYDLVSERDIFFDPEFLRAFARWENESHPFSIKRDAESWAYILGENLVHYSLRGQSYMERFRLFYEYDFGSKDKD